MCSELLKRAASFPCLLSLFCQVEDVPPDAVPSDKGNNGSSSSRGSSTTGSGRKRQSSRSQDHSHEATTSSSSSSLLSASSSAAAAASYGPTCGHCQKHYHNLQPLSCATCATTVRICLSFYEHSKTQLSLFVAVLTLPLQEAYVYPPSPSQSFYWSPY